MAAEIVENDDVPWPEFGDEDLVLPGKLSRQGVEEDLKTRRIRSRHDQIDTSPILRRDRAVQIDVFALPIRFAANYVAG